MQSLPRNAERLTTCREHPNTGASLKQRAHQLGGGLDQVLAIVENQQQVAGPQALFEYRYRRASRRLHEAEHTEYRHRHQGGIVKSCQIHEPDAVAKALEFLSCNFQSEPSLAAATR